MKKYLLWFRLLIKRQLNYKFLLIFLAALPLCAFAVSKTPQMHENTPPKIGLYLCDNDLLSTAAAGALTAESNDAAVYYIAASKEELIQDIINKTADCGYIFEENLTDKIMSGKFSSSITLLKSPSSIMNTLSSEMVFFTVFKIFGKEIALNYIEHADAFADIKENALNYVDERFDYYLNGPATFHVKFKTYDTKTDSRIDYNAKTDLFPLRGILAVLIFTAGLFGSVQLLIDRDNGVFAVLPFHFILSGHIIYPFISAGLFAISSIVTLIVTGQFTNAFSELSAIIVYTLLVAAFSALLSCIIKSTRFFTAIIPTFMLCSLICCPVFFNLSSYMPFVAVIRRFLVPFYYLLFTA